MGHRVRVFHFGLIYLYSALFIVVFLIPKLSIVQISSPIKFVFDINTALNNINSHIETTDVAKEFVHNPVFISEFDEIKTQECNGQNQEGIFIIQNR